MSNDLSKQLCELCGIEPERDCINCPHPCETACNNCSYGELVYPDFENNNNNFVKLFELKIVKDVSIAELLFKLNIANYSKEIFLNNLFYILKPDSNIENNTKDIIKQFIREAKWEV